ncbi:hypothetical protein Q5752_002304 [Cryptotrichosporon argae]
MDVDEASAGEQSEDAVMQWLSVADEGERGGASPDRSTGATAADSAVSSADQKDGAPARPSREGQEPLFLPSSPSATSHHSQRAASSSSDVVLLPDQPAPVRSPVRHGRVYVDVPRLSPSTRAMYKSFGAPTSSAASSGLPHWRTAASAQSAWSVSEDEDGEGEDELESGRSLFSEDELDLLDVRRSGRHRRSGNNEETGIKTRTRGPASDAESSTSSSSYGHSHRAPGKMQSTGKRRTERRYGRTPDSGSDYDPDGEEAKDQLNASDDEPVDRGALYHHREYCERCRLGPADELRDRAQKRKKRQTGKKKRKVDEDLKGDEELANELEGWLECERCVVSCHWGCLGPTQKRDVLVRFAMMSPQETGRKSVAIDEEGTFICARCASWGRCFVCNEEWQMGGAKDETDEKDEKNEQDGKDALKEEVEQAPTAKDASKSADRMYVDKQLDADGGGSVKETIDPIGLTHADAEEPAPYLFRCIRCRQAAHYEHLKNPFHDDEEHTLNDIAEHYQTRSSAGQAWFCHQCRDWQQTVDLVIAWRPCPPNAVEPPREEGELPRWKDNLPREYLVKWTGRGFRHLSWVPHPWMQATTQQKLKRFLEKGVLLDVVTNETLAAKGDVMAAPTIAAVLDDAEPVVERHGKKDAVKDEWEGHGPAPDPDAEANIPVAWSTIDRILDVMMFPPTKKTLKPKSANGRKTRILSESPELEPAPLPEYEDGVEPPIDQQMNIDDWERQSGRKLDEDDADEIAGLVAWCYVKWDDLQYDQSTWDTPPPRDSLLYAAYKRALSRYLRARRIQVPVLNAAQARERDRAAEQMGKPPKEQPDCIVGGALMPFQLEGFQWLLYKHFKRESCILADDMGLGKTIQVASFLGYLGSEGLGIYPALVVVPNSTITNWVREFEKWVPHIRVVPYYGEASSRKVISQYELYHKGLQNKAAGLKAHVVLTTYDTITGSEFRIFSNVPRWEVLIIDEGQRLKSDSSLMFNRLKQLNTVHRVLLTGTPLNNNLRELFNLLNFLDADTFRALEDLEARFADLNEGLVQELHEMIKPYILRRIKADVLKLPPKVEIIVPISLSPLQKGLYKSILQRNADIIDAMLEARRKRAVPSISGGGAIDGKGKGEGKGKGKAHANGVAEKQTAANGVDKKHGPAVEPNGTDESQANGAHVDTAESATPNGNAAPASASSKKASAAPG